LTIPEPGWQAYRVQSDAVGLLRQELPAGHLDIGQIRGVLTEPCNPEGQAISAGETPEDLMDAVKDVLFLSPGQERELTVGDYEGKEIDFIVDAGAQAACGSIAGGSIAIFKMGSVTWGADPSELVRLMAIDVNGQTISFVLSGDDPTGSVPSNELFFNSAEQVVQTVKFL
jgi:hypothetical protein